MNNEAHLRQLGILRRLGYFTLIFWPAFLIAGFMAFDAPSSEKHLWPYVALCFSLAYGLIPFVVPRLSNRALAAGRIKLAYCVAAIPIAIASAPFIAKFLGFF